MFRSYQITPRLSIIVKVIQYTGRFLAQHSAAMLKQCCHY